jgi:hypothetical protein
MANDRLFDLEDALLRPGCYLNPQTEVMIVVDDSSSIDTEIFNLEEFEGADWVLVSDDVPVDEAQRDELLERLEVSAVRAGQPDEDDDDEIVEDEEELEPDPDEDYE